MIVLADRLDRKIKENLAYTSEDTPVTEYNFEVLLCWGKRMRQGPETGT